MPVSTWCELLPREKGLNDAIDIVCCADVEEICCADGEEIRDLMNVHFPHMGKVYK